ncbi:uncharacterized protein LOC117666542 [Pantherophis guttatus]|uniref:Uncharacterized protein LOC117666542 n=1 Tax=Pantherophis guttatus TaxID=94885 RepID=A0A6P9C5U2_PANGU|nr:uncharacterized protein LOC117666542 [Pantherophis guttatus]
MNDKIENIQQTMTKKEQRIQNVEIRAEQTEKKMEAMEQKLTLANRNLEETIVFLEMEKAAFFLRFRNIVEDKEEDLVKVMTDLLATILQKNKHDIQGDIDEVFRIQTNYTRRHKLPREVYMRFTKKTIRDEVYKRTRDEAMMYKGREIQILKQIPRRVREQRRQYQFLSTQLIKYNVTFRWLIPEGMLISWQEKKFRINTLDKGHEFFEHYFTTDEDPESREEVGRSAKKNITQKKKM